MKQRALIFLIGVLILFSGSSQGTAAEAPVPGRIAFVRSGNLWIWEAGSEQRVTEGRGATSPQFSSDGRYVTFQKDRALWVVRPGAVPWKVGDTAGCSVASWSPSESTLTFAEGQDVFTVRVSDGGLEPRRLIAKGWTAPAWSPDGRFLALARNTGREDFTGTAEIGVVSASGGEPRVLWNGEYLKEKWVGPATGLKWSPDGRWIAFYRSALSASPSADANQINVLSIETGEVTPLGFGPMNRAYFGWAPTAVTLAFTDGAGRFAWGDKKIKVTPMPPQTDVPSPTAPGYADREPAWSPDGEAVYFIRSVAQAPELMYQPAREQAIWRWNPGSGKQAAVPGTGDALGVEVGRGGQLLWPRGDGKQASLWTVEQGEPKQVIAHMDFSNYYYGQFYWDSMFDWWTNRH